MQRKASLFVLVVILVSLLLSACGPRALPSVSGTGIGKIDPLSLINKGRKYYNEGVGKETALTNLWVEYSQKKNAFDTGVRDLWANKQSCFSDVAATESAIGEAVMSNAKALDKQALINVLATGQSVTGESATTACVQLNNKIADYIMANRESIQNSYMSMFEGATGYMSYLSNWPEVDIINDLLQTYGDTATVWATLAENGVGVSDWSWLPTSNLWVSHRDRSLCEYYLSEEFKKYLPRSLKQKFEGHEEALYRMYEASWNPAAFGGQGECRMTRMAALEYMTRSIISENTRQQLETGVDTGAIPTPSK